MSKLTYVLYNRQGFANTWNVVAFASKEEAKAWANAPWKGWYAGEPRIIPRREVGKWVGRPRPFSGKRLMVLPEAWGGRHPWLGVVDIVHPDDEATAIPVWG